MLSGVFVLLAGHCGLHRITFAYAQCGIYNRNVLFGFFVIYNAKGLFINWLYVFAAIGFMQLRMSISFKLNFLLFL